MADYKMHPGSKATFTITVDEKAVQKAQKGIIERYKQTLSISGFRPGKAPESMVVAKVGVAQLGRESLSRAFDKAYWDFIEANKLKPITEPTIVNEDAFSSMPAKVEVSIEVFPEVTVGDYKSIEPKPVKVKVTKKMIDEFIVKVLTDMKLGTPVKRAAKDGDMVVVSFGGRLKKGEDVLPNTKGENVDHVVGSKRFLPDLEAAMEGMKAGDKKEGIKVKFPKDYGVDDFNGKTILFDLEMHAVKAADPAKITEEDIKTITQKELTQDEFRTMTEGIVKQKEEQAARDEAVKTFKEKLADMTKVDLPTSWVQAEINQSLSRIYESNVYKRDPKKFWDLYGKKEDEVKKDAETKAVKELTAYMALQEVMKQEKPTLNEDMKKALAKENNRQKRSHLELEYQIEVYLRDKLAA